MDIFRTLIRLTRPRKIHRLFRRLTLLGTLVNTGVSKEVPASLAHMLNHAARTDAAILLPAWHTREDGLSNREAAAIRTRVGVNEVGHEQPPSAWVHLWHSYRNPFNLLLTLLAVVSYLTADMKAALVISSMVVLSTLLRFWQESKSNQAADQLKAMVSNTASVLRRAPKQSDSAALSAHPNTENRTEIPIKDLVPGDIVLLSAGDMIPADCRVLFSKDLLLVNLR